MKSVNVLGQTIGVLYDDDQLKKDELGLFDSTSMRIYILSSLKNHPLHDSVLTHEICHAIIHISGLSHVLGNGVEESLCMAMEYGLRPFISHKGNKK